MLTFNVRNQSISRTDRTRVMTMSRNYPVAHFNFLTDDWDGLSKIAIFTKDDRTFKTLLDQHGDAVLPWEHLETPGVIEVSVYGGDLITVNTATITVEDSGYTDNAENEQPPTPEIWEQLLERIENIDGGTFEDWGDE